MSISDELIYRPAKQVKRPSDGVFGLDGHAQLGPHNSKSAAIVISFWDDSVRQPIFLSARYGLSSGLEAALSSIEPVKARFRIDNRRGSNVVGCQLPATIGDGWQEWEVV